MFEYRDFRELVFQSHLRRGPGQLVTLHLINTSVGMSCGNLHPPTAGGQRLLCGPPPEGSYVTPRTAGGSHTLPRVPRVPTSNRLREGQSPESAPARTAGHPPAAESQLATSAAPLYLRYQPLFCSRYECPLLPCRKWQPFFYLGFSGQKAENQDGRK